MKTKLLTLLLLCASTSIFAQYSYYAERQYKPYDKYWQVDFAFGSDFDLTYTGSRENASVLSTRPTAAPFLNFRSTHLFSKKVGWYANVQLSLYYQESAELFEIPTSIIDDFFIGLGEGLSEAFSLPHPALDAGFVYRIETGRFRIHPSIGLGVNGHMYNSTKERSATKNNVTYTVKYKQDASYLFAGLGVTASYDISNKSYLLFRANYRQPLQKTKARMIYLQDDVEKENIYYESWTPGRNLNLSLGYGFRFGKRVSR